MRIERELMILENEAEEYGFNLSEEQFDRPHITDNISKKDLSDEKVKKEYGRLGSSSQKTSSRCLATCEIRRPQRRLQMFLKRLSMDWSPM